VSELRLDYQPNSTFPWLGALFLVVGIAGLAALGAHYHQLGEQVARAEAKLLHGSDRTTKTNLSERHTAELAQEVDHANEVLRQLSVPWATLFEAIESSSGGKVTLLALEPDVGKHQVKINGETKTFKSLTQYLTRLQEQTVFGSVYLQSHQVQQQDADKPVRFSLLATWREQP
jgi:Tfp pilus assembly protein PilN